MLVSLMISNCSGSKRFVRVENSDHNIQSNIKELSGQIYDTMLQCQKRKVAVLEFNMIDGRNTKLGVYLADKLVNDLFIYQNKFDVVDRFHLKEIMKEYQFGIAGLQDPNTVQKIGKIIGADAVVTGIMTDLGETVDVNIRMLDTERIKVLAVANTYLKKNATILDLLDGAALMNPPVRQSVSTDFGTYTVRLFNVDDLANLYLNGILLYKAKWGYKGTSRNWAYHGHKVGDSGIIDITPELNNGENTVRITLENSGCCFASLEILIKKDEKTIYSDSFPRQQEKREGVVFEKKIKIFK
jgi:TolB-like protein